MGLGGARPRSGRIAGSFSRRNESERRRYLQVCVLGGADPLVRRRPPGRPSRTGPTILARFPHQSGAHGVLLDVIPNSFELPLLPYHTIVALLLPKWFSR